jgi:hypothetical protein
MNAGLGARFLPEDFRRLVALFAAFLRAAGRRFADFLADFFLLPAVFFFRLVAIACLPEWVRTVLCLGTNENYRDQQ